MPETALALHGRSRSTIVCSKCDTDLSKKPATCPCCGSFIKYPNTKPKK